MKLTWDQIRAVESIDKPTAIIAGAGSGKTEVLTSRLIHILKNSKAGLHQILAITFTEKAANEMKQRIAKNLDPQTKKELPWAAIGTFHSFCLNILREQAALVGLSHLFSVWDEHTSKLSIHRHCRDGLLQALHDKQKEALLLVEEIEFRNALALLEELMAFRWHWERLQLSAIRCQPPAKEGELLEATKKLYDQILKNYEEEKRQREVVDFQDLEILTLKLFQENKEVRKNYQNRFAHILVDEAQDLNDLQQELIQLLFHPKKNCLCIVGDPKQSIYRFRGANVDGFKKMIAAIVEAKGTIIQLNENFRSRPGILEWINHTFASLLDPQDFSKLIAIRQTNDKPNILILNVEAGEEATKEERRKQEAKQLAQFIQTEVKNNSLHMGDFALLFQSLMEVRHYEEAFKEMGIPYRIFGGRGFLNAQEVLDCLFILKIMANLEDRLALVGLMRSPFIGLPDTQITEMCLQHPLPSPTRGEGKMLAEAIFELKEALWLKKLWEQKEKLSGAQILEQAILATNYDCLLYQLDPSGAKLANIEQLIQLVRELETKEEMALEDLLEYFETLKERRAPLSNAPAVDASEQSHACQLLTVHAAKGLQFPIVILPDLIRSQPQTRHRYLFARKEGLGFYLRESDSPFSDFVPSERLSRLNEREKFHDLNERKRLLYVAMTRAKEQLVIPLHENCSKTGPWHQWIKEALENWSGNKSLATRGTSPTLYERRIIEGNVPSQVPVFPNLQSQTSFQSLPYYTVTDLEKRLRPSDQPSSSHRKSKEGLSGADIGNLVHACIKEIDFASKMPLKNLVQIQALNLNLNISKKEWEEVTQMIEIFLKSEDTPPLDRGFHELPFRLKMKKGVITGIIDYTYETKEDWIIVDFKTDSTFDKERYQLQMDIYALALSKAKPKPILETRLIYLKLGKTHREPCTKERLLKTESVLDQLLYE